MHNGQDGQPAVPLQNRDVDVAVVGFGPVGAMLTALLGQRGLRVAVFDRERDVFPLPRAAHIDHQGLRLVQEIGCLDEVLPTMLPNPGIDFVTADRQLLSRLPGNQPSLSGLPASMYFHQPGFDRALRRKASAAPHVQTHLETDVVGLEQAGDCATLIARKQTGGAERITAKWVVACDGATSTIRELSGIGLHDLGFHEEWVVIDLLLKRGVAGLPDRAVTVCDPDRPLTMIPIPQDRYRFEVKLMPGDGDPASLTDPENVFELIADWITPDDADVERGAVYRFHGLIAEEWRDGRVLLAGDAAHQMPPFLGQGMCSGLRDASNLAWKLALSLRGAPDELLDTYELERRPHVTEIVRIAVEYGRLTCITDHAAAAARDREWLRDPKPATHRLPFKLPALEPGPLVVDGGGELFPQPYARDDEPRLDDVAGDGFLVVAKDVSALGASADWWRDEVGALVRTIDELPGGQEIASWLDSRDATVVVVRPDRYVLGANRDLAKMTSDLEAMLVAPRAEPATP